MFVGDESRSTEVAEVSWNWETIASNQGSILQGLKN